MAIEENVTITETAPDGTQTTVEITTTKADDTLLSDDKSLVEEVVEALFDTDAEDETELEAFESEFDTAEGDPVMFEATPTEEEITTNSIEFTVGEDGFPVTDVPETEVPVDFAETTAYDTPLVDTPLDTANSDAASDTSTAEGKAAELSEQQANVDAAKEAQAAADEFVAQGDYAAAADAREVAENAAYEAGDSSMLGVSDSSDLENAAYKQEVAENYRQQQQENIAEGDYAAAKEDAQNAGYATGDADYLASGSDHTGQSDNDVYNLDNAVYQEKNADAAVDNAGWYAAQGDADGVERNLEQAGAYQASADEFASRADQESYNYQEDPSSVVETGGTYDAGSYDAASVGTYDAGAYDASVASVDTGIDTSVDTSAASTYDTTTDDTV